MVSARFSLYTLRGAVRTSQISECPKVRTLLILFGALWGPVGKIGHFHNIRKDVEVAGSWDLTMVHTVIHN